MRCQYVWLTYFRLVFLLRNTYLNWNSINSDTKRFKPTQYINDSFFSSNYDLYIWAKILTLTKRLTQIGFNLIEIKAKYIQAMDWSNSVWFFDFGF